MIRNHARWAGWCVAGALVVIAAGCSIDDVLDVDNPDEIPIDQLDDPGLLQVRLNGVVDAFDAAYVGQVVRYANYMTDELVSGLNWESYERASRRHVSYLEGPTNNIFANLSRGMRLADGLAEDTRRWATDDPDTDFDPELAQTLAYAGYSAVVLAENTCQAVISLDPDDPSDVVLSQLETFEAALPYLEEALTVAQQTGETDIANLALTGLARAHLGRGEWADAASYASQVAAEFEWWMEYVDLPDGRNPLQATSHGGNFTNGIHPFFTGAHPSFDGTGFSFRDDDVIAPQMDPRIQHEVEDETGHNGLTPLYKLFQGLRYSDYNGETISPASAECPGCTGTDAADMPLLSEFDTDVLMADYLEAQHHLHEALAMQGDEAAVSAFVNERRAAGNQAPVTLAGQALITELRNQRARDLFMGGFRVPDLRRWTRFDAGNGPFAGGSYFPTGDLHPNVPVFGSYGEWTCFPIPLQEYEGNDNLESPADPNMPPGI